MSRLSRLFVNPLPRPRDRTAAAFVDLRRRLRRSLEHGSASDAEACSA